MLLGCCCCCVLCVVCCWVLLLLCVVVVVVAVAVFVLLLLYPKSVKKNYVALKESAAITLSTNCDLAIESLGVRVATIVLRMMKRKVATRRISNFDSAIPGLLAKLHRMVFASFSRSPECKRFVVLVLVKTCENSRSGLKKIF